MKRDVTIVFFLFFRFSRERFSECYLVLGILQPFYCGENNLGSNFKTSFYKKDVEDAVRTGLVNVWYLERSGHVWHLGVIRLLVSMACSEYTGQCQ